jgi:hypothetical protein
VAGPPAGWSYGQLQVEVTLSGSRILDVAVARLICDGLLLHPLVGPTKEGDVPVEVRMRAYEAALR